MKPRARPAILPPEPEAIQELRISISPEGEVRASVNLALKDEKGEKAAVESCTVAMPEKLAQALLESLEAGGELLTAIHKGLGFQE